MPWSFLTCWLDRISASLLTPTPSSVLLPPDTLLLRRSKPAIWSRLLSTAYSHRKCQHARRHQIGCGSRRSRGPSPRAPHTPACAVGATSRRGLPSADNSERTSDCIKIRHRRNSGITAECRTPGLELGRIEEGLSRGKPRPIDLRAAHAPTSSVVGCRP